MLMLATDEKALPVRPVSIVKQCPKCDGNMRRKEDAPILTTFPPQYTHQCSKCGHTEIYTETYPRIVFMTEDEEIAYEDGSK